PEFGFRVLADVDRIVVRRHAAARGQLDLARAQHELLAHALADFVRTVSDHATVDRLAAAEGSVARSLHLVRHAEIAMPAGLRDHRPGWPDARTFDDARVDGPLEREAGAAEVADAGESAHQRVARLVPGGEVDVADV